MEKEKWKEINNNGYYDNQFLFDNDREISSRERSPTLPSSVTSSPSRVGCIEHYVTKFDTLAGIAIKYGVEVFSIINLMELFFSFFLCLILLYYYVLA